MKPNLNKKNININKLREGSNIYNIEPFKYENMTMWRGAYDGQNK